MGCMCGSTTSRAPLVQHAGIFLVTSFRTEINSGLEPARSVGRPCPSVLGTGLPTAEIFAMKRLEGDLKNPSRDNSQPLKHGSPSPARHPPVLTLLFFRLAWLCGNTTPVFFRAVLRPREPLRVYFGRPGVGHGGVARGKPGELALCLALTRNAAFVSGSSCGLVALMSNSSASMHDRRGAFHPCPWMP